jgi:hypothetical protein
MAHREKRRNGTYGEKEKWHIGRKGEMHKMLSPKHESIEKCRWQNSIKY